MNKKKKNRPLDIGFYIMIFVVVMAVIFMLMTGEETNAISYSDVVHQFEQENVSSFVIEGNMLEMKLRQPLDGRYTITHELYSVSIFYEDLHELIDSQMASGVLQEYDYIVGWEAPWWLNFLPYVVIMIIFIVVWFVLMNKGSGGDKGVMKFGKARTRVGSPEKKKITFKDVAGADEEKEELEEIVQFLKNPKRYVDIGARIPKGVLLVGPPGTGKTLLAKAVAGEAGVQFLSISGSDFVELYVGVGASRVRDLFEQAKKAAPSIIFIDEIDAVGRQRGAGLGGGHDEREQTLNQLLVEMDGFGTNEGVIVMAATNRQDILDRALLRPGRFDRQVYVGLPDVKGREEILKIHAKGKPLSEDVDLASIAKGTPGFSGADLENLMNEAALLAVRRGKRFLTMEDVDDAILKVSMGPEKKSRRVIEKERRLTAYHEAGHAVVSHFLEHSDPVHYITIIPRGSAGGFTLYRPAEDKSFQSRNEMFDQIVSALGGRMAEKLFLDDISTGAGGDIQQASRLARAMVTKYGMSEKLGPISYESSDQSIFIGRDFGHTKSYSEETAALIDEEVKRLFDEAAELCAKILSEHRVVLVGVAEYLLEHETMQGSDFVYYCENGTLPEPENNAASDDVSAEMPEANDAFDALFGIGAEDIAGEAENSDEDPE